MNTKRRTDKADSWVERNSALMEGSNKIAVSIAHIAGQYAGEHHAEKMIAKYLARLGHEGLSENVRSGEARRVAERMEAAK